MTSGQRQGLLQSIATTIGDYRQGEIPAITPPHVEKWVSQFDGADQPVILEEMNAILGKYYVRRTAARAFVERMLTSTSAFGQQPDQELRNTLFLRIQRKGNSQNELLILTDELLKSLYGFGIQACGGSPTRYLYLDDCLFSGNTAWHDLHQWLPAAAQGTRLDVIFFATHSGGMRYLRNNLDPETNARSMPASYWALHTFHNIPWQPDRSECLWPHPIAGEPLVDGYVQQVLQRCQGKSFKPRLFRPPGTPSQETLFSSPAARDVVERAFTKAGCYIVSLPAVPNWQMRPLGYEFLESLGFGSLFVTYRNVANNCPLVLWWGDPGQPAGHPLSKWYPLFPRKVNAPLSGFDLGEMFGT